MFPHCERRATNADIDHTHDHAHAHAHGGRTTASNLAHLCRFHHVLKHTTAWTYTADPGGEIRWRSPAGQHHVSRAKSAVMFIDTEDARAYRRRNRRVPPEDSASGGTGADGGRVEADTLGPKKRAVRDHAARAETARRLTALRTEPVRRMTQEEAGAPF